MAAKEARRLRDADLGRKPQQARRVGHAGHADVYRQLDAAPPHALHPSLDRGWIEAQVADDVRRHAALVPHRLDRHVVMDERVALGISGDTDFGEPVVRRQRLEQRDRVGKLSSRLARVARDDEHAANAGHLQRLHDLAELDAVADQARRKMWDGAIAELGEAHRQVHGGWETPPRRCRDGESDLFRHVGCDQIHDVVGREDLIARRAEKPGQCLPHTLRTQRPNHATIRALCATPPLERQGEQQNDVAVEWRARAAGVEARGRNVARELAMQVGQPQPVVVQHRAGDRQEAVSRPEKLDQARLARPIDQRAGRHLPEALTAAGIATRRDPVRVDVAVQPKHDVAKPQQQVQQRVRAPLAAGVGESVVTVVREDDNVPVRMPRPSGRTVAGQERGMDLLEPALQPVQLCGVDASIRATRITHGVERDVANVTLVMHVARLPRFRRREAVSPVAHVCIDELGA